MLRYYQSKRPGCAVTRTHVYATRPPNLRRAPAGHSCRSTGIVHSYQAPTSGATTTKHNCSSILQLCYYKTAPYTETCRAVSDSQEDHCRSRHQQRSLLAIFLTVYPYTLVQHTLNKNQSRPRSGGERKVGWPWKGSVLLMERRSRIRLIMNTCRP